MKESIWQREDWTEFVGPDWVARIMNQKVTDRFHAKQGRSTGRLILYAGSKKLAVYLKRHYQLPWWQGLLASLWPNRGWSPAMEELRHLQWARSEGFSVPSAVAAAEYVGPWGRFQSMLAVEELADMLPLHEAIPLASRTMSDSEFARWKYGLTAEVAHLARELHNRRYFHKDLYLCHFYIPTELIRPVSGWQGKVYIIDLHRLGHHPFTAVWWRVKDIAQLAFSSAIEGVDDRDRLRFWKLYLGDQQASLMESLLRRFIVMRWNRYRRHNMRQTEKLKTEPSVGISSLHTRHGGDEMESAA